MRSKHESAILSTDTCQQILFSDRCQMNITWMRNIKDACDKPAPSNLREKPSVGNQVVTFHTDLHEGMYTHADGWTDRMHICTQYVCIHTENHMTTKTFQLHGLPNFLSNGPPLTCLLCAGTLLIKYTFKYLEFLKIFNISWKMSLSLNKRKVTRPVL